MAISDIHNHVQTTPDMRPLPNFTCPRCGAPNECAPARSGTFATPCWCTAVTASESVLAEFPAGQALACLCRRCISSGHSVGGDERRT